MIRMLFQTILFLIRQEFLSRIPSYFQKAVIQLYFPKVQHRRETTGKR